MNSILERAQLQLPWSKDHVVWLVDTGQRLKTKDGKNVVVLEFQHKKEPAILSKWAKHFRNHYLLDSEIDSAKLVNNSRKEHLIRNVFPSANSNLGPPVRAGDFAEILVADYVEWVLGHWVPRVRWAFKDVPDTSPKGCDVIGFRFHNEKTPSLRDVLTVIETKAKFSASGDSRLQDAITDSAKDQLRLAESLNALRQKLRWRNDTAAMERVARFQTPVDVPYTESYGAVAVFCAAHFTESAVKEAACTWTMTKRKKTITVTHPNADKLFLMVVKGPEMMKLVNELYELAAAEA